MSHSASDTLLSTDNSNWVYNNDGQGIDKLSEWSNPHKPQKKQLNKWQVDIKLTESVLSIDNHTIFLHCSQTGGLLRLGPVETMYN